MLHGFGTALALKRDAMLSSQLSGRDLEDHNSWLPVDKHNIGALSFKVDQDGFKNLQPPRQLLRSRTRLLRRLFSGSARTRSFRMPAFGRCAIAKNILSTRRS